MVKKLMKVAGIFVMVCLLMNSTAFGKAKATKATEIKVKGTVNVVKEAKKITSVTLTTKDATYNVVLDATGMKIGKTEADKKIKATGVVSQKDDQKWIEVKTFEAVKEKHKKGK
jgi:NADH:ubiquinone oxidoreductase subunit C